MTDKPKRIRISRRKLAPPKAVVDVPASITIELYEDVPIAWFASSKSSEAIRKLTMTERELVARAFAESTAPTLDAFVHAALQAWAKATFVNSSRSRVDYAAAYERLKAIGIEITSSKLGREAKDRTGKISGNSRSAQAWLEKNVPK